MPTLRVASSNLEWMNDWFTSDGEPPGHAVHRRLRRLRRGGAEQALAPGPHPLSPALSAAVGLRRIPGSGTIHHAEYEGQIAHGGAKREDRPADHRPVSVRLTY
jgi:hypothetical protein